MSLFPILDLTTEQAEEAFSSKEKGVRMNILEIGILLGGVEEENILSQKHLATILVY